MSGLLDPSTAPEHPTDSSSEWLADPAPGRALATQAGWSHSVESRADIRVLPHSQPHNAENAGTTATLAERRSADRQPTFLQVGLGDTLAEEADPFSEPFGLSDDPESSGTDPGFSTPSEVAPADSGTPQGTALATPDGDQVPASNEPAPVQNSAAAVFSVDPFSVIPSLSSDQPSDNSFTTSAASEVVAVGTTASGNPSTVTPQQTGSEGGSGVFSSQMSLNLYAEDDAFTVKHDTALTVENGGVTANDALPANVSFMVVIENSPAHGGVLLLPDGSFTYTPQPGYAGQDSFAYRLLVEAEYSNTATVSIDVVNTAPVADGPAYFTHAGQMLSVSTPGVLGSADDEDGDSLTAQLVQGPAHASTFLLSADGGFQYHPQAGFAGTDSFTFRVFDGVAYSDVTTATIEVDNQAPVGIDDEYFVSGGMPVTTCSGQVLSNDFDPDGDPLSAQLVSGPDPASTSLFVFGADGQFDFTPAMNFLGTVTFTYQASDGTAQSDVVTVTIHVVAAPVGRDDYYLLDGDNPVVVDAANSVLTNDFDPSDPAAALRAQLVTPPPSSSGTLTLNGLQPDGTFDGTFTFTPAPGLAASVTFAYQPVNATGQAGNVTAVQLIIATLNGLDVRLQSVTFKANAVAPTLKVIQDPKPNAGASIGYLVNQWYDANGNGQLEPGDASDPIAYVRSTGMTPSKIKLDAVLLLDPGAAQLLEATLNDPRYSANVKVVGEGPGGMTFTADASQLSLNRVQGRLYLNGVEASTALGDKVSVTDSFAINWKLEYGIGSLTRNAGQSRNQLYVTFQAPVAIPLPSYHTVIDVGTRGAAGLGDGDNALLPVKIFDKFATLQVKRVDGVTLNYYANWQIPSFSTAGLLVSGDGRCGAWSKFFLDTLKVQGMSYTDPLLTIRSVNGQGRNEGMMVKQWNFIAPAHPLVVGGILYPYAVAFNSGDLVVVQGVTIVTMNLSSQQATYQFLGLPRPGQAGPWPLDVDGNARLGLKGQGNKLPPALFDDHAIVEIGNVFYDPSYGTKYTGNDDQARLNALEAAAIAGFSVVSIVGPNAILRARQSTGAGGLRVTSRDAY